MENIFGLDEKLITLASQAESECTAAFAEIDRIAEINGQKVLKAFIDNRVSEGCLKGTTGYGYG
ncbi:MAG: methionine gamma-lyase family protein, partial [Ruminococcus sp.]|nr:methionine gamma-lyase family protein [Ruminococcus sp.]